MRPKPVIALACALAALAVTLPACGDEDQAADQNPASAEDLQVLERRMGAVERQLRDLRKALKSRREEGQRSSADQPGDEIASVAPPDAAVPASGSGEPGGSSASAPGVASGSDFDSGAGSRSGGSSGPGGGSRSAGSGDRGAGPDPGSPEVDRTVEDICGPNPAPEC